MNTALALSTHVEGLVQLCAHCLRPKGDGHDGLMCDDWRGVGPWSERQRTLQLLAGILAVYRPERPVDLSTLLDSLPNAGEEP